MIKMKLNKKNNNISVFESDNCPELFNNRLKSTMNKKL